MNPASLAAEQPLEVHTCIDGGNGGSRKASPTDLPHPQGKVVGPLEAGKSHYFLYLPKSLVAGRAAPLLEAIKDLDKLSKGPLSEFGVGSRHKHTSQDVSREAARLLKKYQGIPESPEIPEILTNLQKQTP